MKRKMTRTRDLVRKVSLMLGPSLFVATAVFADTGESAGSGGMSPLMLGFLIFLAVIIGIQLIPAMVIFGSLITAVFKRSKKATDTVSADDKV